MKALYSLLFITTFSMPLFAETITENIDLKVGEKKRIELPSNRTTGYSWFPMQKIENSQIIKLVSSGYEPEKTDRVGSGGIQFWNIQGKKAGKCTLVFEYKRPWEKNIKPVKVKKFTITVE